MELLRRGVQSYLVILGGVSILVFLWGANRFLLDSSATDIRWPLLVGITVVLVVLLMLLHRVVSTGGREEVMADNYPWNNR